MVLSSPKYSIIIPSRNGGKYLPYCVKTIIEQDYNNYELLISDDHSTDDTVIFLNSIHHSNIKILTPPVGLSMSEHWEWALSHAIGEWIIFVGQDDGLQSYFFKLADKLTGIAHKKSIRAIMSERALFFWKDSSFYYGDAAIRYRAKNAIRIKSCKLGVLKAFTGIWSYFYLPAMYTTSMFHKDLIIEAKNKQKGRLFVTHPQDANLAAIACSLEKRYLMSFIPLGWVGSSKKSAGMAIRIKDSDNGSKTDTKSISELKNEYVKKISKSELEYNYLAGDFKFGNLGIYFWQSFLQTASLQGSSFNSFIMSKYLRAIIFCRALNEIRSSENYETRLLMFKDILTRNNFRFSIIYVGSIFTWLVAGVILLSYRITRKLIRLLSPHIDYDRNWSDDESMDILKASDIISKFVVLKKMI